MGLVWQVEKSPSLFGLGDSADTEYEVHRSESGAKTTEGIYQDLSEALQLAISKLDENVNDNSLYFLIGWEPLSAAVTISITDDNRSNDSKVVVRCHFVGLASQYDSDVERHDALAKLSDDLRFWCKEYLSTDQGFSQFSLVALFAVDSKDKTVIL
ncbi:hypothetical protein BTJ40_15310 [Microbulbifer sp. A4B17]|uniref:hypothetical protein n=1 Tax=Microbulbifer sp. A4B17 TaxID=359370 RepID=UPI000D52C751|nr:hypothetical protein [Microbulbifer sp. A4B17]AWF82087.1 hypothetical protein BTJ40_15310 [Microbulbifer sp. A4B17]